MSRIFRRVLGAGIVIAALVFAATSATSEPVKCVSDESAFLREGNKNVFRVALKNSCAHPQRCKVNVYVVGSTGPIKGATMLTIPAAAAGQYAQKIWDMKVHDHGGSATMSRDCKAI